MNAAGRVVKGLALAFAGVIMVGIFATAVGALALLGQIFDDRGEPVEVTEVVRVREDEQEVCELSINVQLMSVEIVKGDSFKVEADTDMVEVRREEGRVSIEERERGFGGIWQETGTLRVTLPDDKIDKIVLSTGVGKVSVARLIAEEVVLNLGVGKTEIEELSASRRTEIDSGVGALTVHGGTLKDLDLDMGVGRVELMVGLEGTAEIDAGMGELKLELRGQRDDYRIEVDQGLGGLNLDGVELGNERGKNLVKIDGGVGAINLALRDE